MARKCKIKVIGMRYKCFGKGIMYTLKCLTHGAIMDCDRKLRKCNEYHDECERENGF